MTERQRKTLAQMRDQPNDKPATIAGKPAGICPHCGGATFVNGTQRGDSEEVKFQYVRCHACKKTFRAKTVVKSVILYEVGADDDSSSGEASLTLHRESA